MRLPALSQPAQSRELTEAFAGLNRNLRCGDGEFSAMENLSSSAAPLLSPRAPRGAVRTIANPQGLLAKDALAYVDGSKLVYGGYELEMNLSTRAADCPKQLISMGAYLLIFPDNKYLNTQDLTDYGSLEASVTTGEGATVTFTMCQADGAAFGDIPQQVSPPESPVNGQYWIDISQTPHQLKVYSEPAAMWQPVAASYVKISCPGIGQPFAQWDGVFISGCTKALNESLNDTQVITLRGDDYIVVRGMLDQVVTQTDPVTVERRVPRMDYVTESGNRVWGCRYGIEDGKAVNELYACKLGDPKNWNCLMGVSTDSYTVSLGSDGVFTGAATHLGYPLFFKENCIHKIYGSFPANFQVVTTSCRGVQKGSAASIATVDEVLFYKAVSGVCAYDGSLPASVSERLGGQMYDDASAGACGGKYYISMRDADGAYSLFVYDTLRGMWHREDATHARFFTRSGSELYYVDADSGVLTAVGGTEGTLEASVPWSAETGEIGYSHPDNKYVSRLQLRMSLAPGATARVSVQYDSSGKWEPKGVLTGTSVRSFLLPILPVRCDHFKLRLEGTGDFRVYSLARVLEIGGDQ